VTVDTLPYSELMKSFKLTLGLRPKGKHRSGQQHTPEKFNAMAK